MPQLFNVFIMPDWMYAVFSGLGFAVLLFIVVRLLTPYYERKEREHRQQALKDYFEAKERYEKRK